MHRTIKLLIRGFLLFVIIAVIVFVAASVFINSFKPNLENILSNNIGLETRIDGDISLKITPGLSFIANDLKVLSNETYILRIKKAEISVDYIAIFKSEIDIRALRLQRPQVYIVRNENGNYNFESDHISTYAHADSSKLHDFNLSLLRINDGHLLYVDHQYGDTLLVDGINLRSEEIGVAGSLSNIEVDNIMFNGTVSIDRFKLNMLTADSLVFNIDGRGGKMAILPVDNSYYGGKSSGKTILDFTLKPAQLQIQHQITGFDIGMFDKAMQKTNNFKGKLNYKLDITFRSFNWADAKQSLNGTVMIDGEDLQLYGFDIDEVISRFKKSQHFNVVDLGAFFVVGPYGAVFTKGINFAELLSSNLGDSTMITKMASNWNIKNGIAHAEDVAFSTINYRMAMDGSLDFRKNRYNNLTIALINKEGCAAVSQVMNGDFSDPETKSINSIGAITRPIDNLWKDLTKPFRNPCTPIYSGSVEHPK